MRYIPFVSIVAILVVSLNAAFAQNGASAASFVTINALLVLYGGLGVTAIAISRSLEPQPRSSIH